MENRWQRILDLAKFTEETVTLDEYQEEKAMGVMAQIFAVLGKEGNERDVQGIFRAAKKARYERNNDSD